MGNEDLSPEKQQRKPESAVESGVSTPALAKVEDLLARSINRNFEWCAEVADIFPAIARHYLKMRDALTSIAVEDTAEAIAKWGIHAGGVMNESRRAQAQSALAKAGRAPAEPVEPKRNDDGR